LDIAHTDTTAQGSLFIMWRWRGRFGAGAVPTMIAAVLLATAPARASLVQLRAQGAAPWSSADLQFTGFPGESNLVTLELSGPGEVHVRDDGAPLHAGENCSGGGHEVVCSGLALATALALDIALSDGDDRLAISGARAYASSFLSGGRGADVISGAAGDDNILGGAGDDTLDGGSGNDRLLGLQGADVLRGGEGIDTVVFDDHTDPVTVTIDGRADDGAVGEGDDVAPDVENVTGGHGANRLVGSDAANTLEVEAGRGVSDLVGGAGDDRLLARYADGGRVSGGPGRDILSVAPRSVVDARDGEVDRVECDYGLEGAPLVDAVDVLVSCVPPVESPGVSARVDAAGRVRVPIRCHAVSQSCHILLALRWRARVLARDTLDVGAEQRGALIRLNRLGRRLVRRRAPLRVTRELQALRIAAPRSSGPEFRAPLRLLSA
jgi:RTX calcium-binding nonapeptide repeat (4 copies)